MVNGILADECSSVTYMVVVLSLTLSKTLITHTHTRKLYTNAYAFLLYLCIFNSISLISVILKRLRCF